MKNNPRCPFKNRYMTEPCNKILLKNLNEWFCIYHGTMTFEREAWDPVEEPLDTIEAENGGMSWSQEELAKLFTMLDNDVPVEYIARVLGRSKNSIYNKLYLLKNER